MEELRSHEEDWLRGGGIRRGGFGDEPPRVLLSRGLREADEDRCAAQTRSECLEKGRFGFSERKGCAQFSSGVWSIGRRRCSLGKKRRVETGSPARP